MMREKASSDQQIVRFGAPVRQHEKRIAAALLIACRKRRDALERDAFLARPLHHAHGAEIDSRRHDIRVGRHAREPIR